MQAEITIGFGDLVTAFFIQRLNRFVVRCRLKDSGDIVEAHLADPGRLKELLTPEAQLYLRFVSKPKRKTKWTVVLVVAEDGVTLVSLQTTLVNQLTSQALLKDGLPEFNSWELKRSEYTYGNSRWDFLLGNAKGKQLLLEVKSCSLVQDGIAMFPDAVTERGKRHVQELTELQINGIFETAVLFVVQRSDARSFRPADHIDRAFGQALRKANSRGVRILVRDCQVSLTSIDWGKALPIDYS